MDTKEEPDCSFHGVLRYRRECEWTKMNLLPTSASDHTVLCEFCGAKTKPPLDFSKTTNPEDFCCAQYMEMFKKVEQQWHSLHENAEEPSQESSSSVEKVQDNRDRARAQDVLQQVAEECLRKGKIRSSENQAEIPGCKVTTSGLFTTITFRLSDFVRFKKKERLAAREEKPRPFQLRGANSSAPAGFGLCHFQRHSRKLYPDGTKFLTEFPDGTTRVFYPSGNLAIISFIDDTEGVCVVLDDAGTNCPIRACFQSSGLATCYHSNGNTWLHMDASGGLSQNIDGSRRRKWKWTENTNKPTPFKPVHMSLNKNVGVRVRRRDSVVVSFLASGQQARISVGSHTKLSHPVPPPCKEELMLQVSQLSARLAVERLRWCLTTHSQTKHRPLRLPVALVSEGQRLLRLSASIRMEDNTAYIQKCLQDCMTS